MRILTDLVLKHGVNYRFVYDIFIVWEHSLHDRFAFLFIDKINDFNDNIKFMHEFQQDGNLSFIDFNLIQSKENQCIGRIFSSKLIEKIMIPNNSSSPILYKIEVYKFYIRRAFEISSDRYLEKRD